MALVRALDAENSFVDWGKYVRLEGEKFNFGTFVVSDCCLSIYEMKIYWSENHETVLYHEPTLDF